MTSADNSHLASFRGYAAPEGINAPPSREGMRASVARPDGRTPHRNPLICNQNGKFVSVQWERKAYEMA